jgi:hypothetical protein
MQTGGPRPHSLGLDGRLRSEQGCSTRPEAGVRARNELRCNKKKTALGRILERSLAKLWNVNCTIACGRHD